MYNQIALNKRRTILLIAIFVAVIVGIGYAISFVSGGNPTAWLAGALVFSLISALAGYYQGDKMALWSAGAVPIQKQDNPYIYRIVENLCITAGMPVPKIYLIPDSAPNAFATGRDPQHASIAFTTGIIEQLENEELEGVAAHELSHVKNYDIRVMTIVVVLAGTIALLANWFMHMQFLGGRGNDRDRGGGALGAILMIVGLIFIILSPIIAQLIQLAVSRRREFLADASGALLTRYPAGLASALKKISSYQRPMQSASNATAHLYITNPFGASGKRMAKLFSTHPPVEERVKALGEMII
ncbi:MAG TPA: M48 family metallopeptidase [Patescibacteria group bacterium]|nr:M48 family metallopeptidase [Patescibacteria group bacterium]